MFSISSINIQQKVIKASPSCTGQGEYWMRRFNIYHNPGIMISSSGHHEEQEAVCTYFKEVFYISYLKTSI